jgi:hypothetical protein
VAGFLLEKVVQNTAFFEAKGRVGCRLASLTRPAAGQPVKHPGRAFAKPAGQAVRPSYGFFNGTIQAVGRHFSSQVVRLHRFCFMLFCGE